ncbi:homogentisate 1,2-dioxygenase [Sphingomonas sp. Root50]|nr:homogentisate 1,2-dioxygenase [Sphingomonas sp. Root1294]KQY68975.1 homogentisate 1,2-dioxygenase [Sphingomonas sp. Root50]KRB89231.1 homogentisate 1,2-dioxygenase [Sphingomonas sp. Root720]
MGAGMALLISAPALAQMEPPAPADCTTPVPPPAEMAGWTGRTPLVAASDAGQLSMATLAIGRGVDAALSPTADMRYVVRPEKPGGSVSHGGLFGFTIAAAGTYRIAIGSGAWIDVLREGKAVESTAHGHGPACSGIRKMVDFTLRPGRYVLQIAANGSPTLPLLLTRLP